MPSVQGRRFHPGVSLRASTHRDRESKVLRPLPEDAALVLARLPSAQRILARVLQLSESLPQVSESSVPASDPLSGLAGSPPYRCSYHQKQSSIPYERADAGGLRPSSPT